jgi:hypothetical protein
MVIALIKVQAANEPSKKKRNKVEIKSLTEEKEKL